MFSAWLWIALTGLLGASSYKSHTVGQNRKISMYGLKNPQQAFYENLSKTTKSLASAFLVAGMEGIRPSIAESSRLGPVITDKVFMDLKIANYTEESIGTNQGAKGSGRIIIGLYGKDAPQSVARFLALVDGNGVDRPNFINTQFTKIGENGLLEVEKVRKINKIQFAGTDAYEFEGAILAEYANPILESNSIGHTKRALLTRNKLTSTPEFGITLKDDTSSLDGFHCVFGEVIGGIEVLDAIADIPVYTYSTSTGYGGKTKGAEADIADSWFTAQREFYVGAGKALGDQRAVDQRGRLLRRVTIKKCGRL